MANASRPSYPIRIGDSLNRRYELYNPIADTDPAEPNLDDPIDLTGVVVTWNLKCGGVLHTFAEGAGVTVVDAEGRVTVALLGNQTDDFAVDTAAESYIGLNYGGNNVQSKCQLRERVVAKETL